MSWARQTHREQLMKLRASYDEVSAADQILDPER